MPEKKFDPRDLISPPWRTCPACGTDKFGVSIISSSRLLRRCRDCWHQQDYRLPELRKKIILLRSVRHQQLDETGGPGNQGACHRGGGPVLARTRESHRRCTVRKAAIPDVCGDSNAGRTRAEGAAE